MLINCLGLKGLKVTSPSKQNYEFLNKFSRPNKTQLPKALIKSHQGGGYQRTNVNKLQIFQAKLILDYNLSG